MNNSGDETKLTLVLLVDDDPFIHEMVASMIDDGKYSVISAMNAADAIKIMSEQTPDIIITDALMPGESGYSLIHKIKTNPATAEIPVILITILEEPNGSVMDGSGMADFRVSKPLYLSDLTSVLDDAHSLMEQRREVSVAIAQPEVETVTVVF